MSGSKAGVVMLTSEEGDNDIFEEVIQRRTFKSDTNLAPELNVKPDN